MAYSFEKWNLYTADIELKGGIIETLYFFSRWKPRRGTPCDLPNGYNVSVNKRTGLPYLNVNEEVDGDASHFPSQ